MAVIPLYGVSENLLIFGESGGTYRFQSAERILCDHVAERESQMPTIWQLFKMLLPLIR